MRPGTGRWAGMGCCIQYERRAGARRAALEGWRARDLGGWRARGGRVHAVRTRRDGGGAVAADVPQGEPGGRVRLPVVRLGETRRPASASSPSSARTAPRRSPTSPRASGRRPRSSAALGCVPARSRPTTGSTPTGGSPTRCTWRADAHPLRSRSAGTRPSCRIAPNWSARDPDERFSSTPPGGPANEAAFTYQLLARRLGTNNLPDCSNMCHEASGTALSRPSESARARSPWRTSPTMPS